MEVEEKFQSAEADAEVTFSDLQDIITTLKSEWHSEAMDAFTDLREKYEDARGHVPADVQEKLDRWNDRLDELETRYRKARIAYETGEGGEQKSEKERAFSKLVEKGTKDALSRDEIKLLSTDSGSDGGFLVPVERAATLLSKARATSPVREFATVQQIASGDTFEQPVRDREFSVVWEGSERSDPGETQAADFNLEKIPTHMQKAKPIATRQMIEDSQFDVESMVMRQLASDFAQAEAKAFVDGTGYNQPEGILQAADTNSGSITTINSGDNSALTYQGLLDLVYDIEEEEYVQNLRLMFNRKTMADIRGLTDSNGMPIYDPGNAEEGPSVEGLPFSTATDIPTVGSNNLAMICGDFSNYVIVDRLDIQMQVDDISNWPKVEYKTRRRVGGQVVIPEAFRILEITA